ncbi:MAG: hypothetical protein ACI4RD_09790 [Kiritimatiellia bacterium]
MKPRYVIDLDVLAATARVARANADRLGVRLLMALKSFPLPAALPTLAPYVEGFTASGLYEARLARQAFGGPGQSAPAPAVHVHAPAYAEAELAEVGSTCSHVVFNSLAQLGRFSAAVRAGGASVGLRINPGFSSADCLAYDPCCPDSRFGVLWEELDRCDAATLLGCGVEGLHVHALCEGRAEQFAELVERLADRLRSVDRSVVGALRWINLGGGEVINDPAFASRRAIDAVARLRSLGDFALYVEPSEYLVRYAGFLEAHVLDVIRRGKDIAILDVSASCHATDLLLFGMRPDVVSPPALAPSSEAEAGRGPGRTTVLGCVSCLAGDVLGEYVFARPLEVGDTVVFGGLGSYTFAQLSWFNGIRRPDLVVRSGADGERVVRSWDYADYAREFGGAPVTSRPGAN